MLFAFSSAMSTSMMFAIILGYLVALLIGFVFHEAAHAYAAVKHGDSTPKLMGRLTLNPIKHVDPLGLVMLLLVGFGYAKPVPINPQNFKKGRWSDFVVSSAGIFTNFTLALFLSFINSLLNCFAPSVFSSFNFFALLLNSFLTYGILINLCLAFFNLLPIYPLDGFRMLDASIGHKFPNFIRFLQTYSTVIMILIIFIVLFLFNFIGYFALWTQFGFEWVFNKFFGLFL